MAWKPEYIILIFISTCIDYFVSIKMWKEIEKDGKKKYLYLSLFSNLGLLFLFKYFNFFNYSLRDSLISFNMSYNIPDFSLLLPMGISFYTFQTLSYTFDVYNGKREPERHFGIFALYVSFFPQLVAGPIERSERLLPQFYEKHLFDYERTTNGLKKIAWGFFKKVVIADRLAILVNTVYNNPTEYKGIQLIIATVFFAFQIFCDFSGYSDIAIGSAQIMGFELMENFKRPYFSKSISEFWERWHISLSSWFKDYLYIPLGGNRVGVSKHYFNLFFTFLVSGFWHGANWTFLAWGALHGFYLIIEITTKKYRSKLVEILRLRKIPLLHKILQISTTFGLVCFAWIFFRANSIEDALYIIRNLFVGFEDGINILELKNSLSGLGITKNEFLISVISILILELFHLFDRKSEMLERIKGYPLYVRWGIYYTLLFYILFFGAFKSQEFIYFQF